MKKSGVVILSVLLIGALGLIAAVPVSAPTVESSPELSVPDSQTAQQDTESLNSIPADGLVTQNGQTCYYLAGEKQTGLQYIDGKAYIFDESGNMLKSGWYTANGNYFYLNDNGAGVVNCWRLGEDGKYRYLKADGTMASNEWVVDYGSAYYLAADGKKVTGSMMIDGKNFLFDEDGKLVSGPTGLHYICGRAFIFDQNGEMQKSGRFVADGYTFYLDEMGAGVFSS